MNKHLNILIIEDNHPKYIDIRDALVCACSIRNISVTIINKDAINPALYHLYHEKSKIKYDFIFVDKILPRFSNDIDNLIVDGGIEILRWMQHKHDTTPVILCSSEAFNVEDMPNIIGSIQYSPTIYLTDILGDLLFKGGLGDEIC